MRQFRSFLLLVFIAFSLNSYSQIHILEQLRQSQIGGLPDALALYQINETSGVVATDEIGNYDADIVGGVTLGETGHGNTGTSFLFAEGNHLDLGKIDFGTGDFSVVFWMKASDQPQNSNKIVGNDPTQQGWVGWHVQLDTASNLVQFYTVGVVCRGTTDVADGAWYMVACRRNATHLEILVNNVSESLVAEVAKNVTNAGNTFVSQTLGTFEYIGNIAQLHLYDHYITTDEMDAIWNGGDGVNY